MIGYDTDDYKSDYFKIDAFLVWRKSSPYNSPTAISGLKVHYRGTKQAKRLILKLIMENAEWLYIDSTDNYLSYNDKLPNFLYNLKPDDGNDEIARKYVGVDALRKILENIIEGEEKCNIQC